MGEITVETNVDTTLSNCGFFKTSLCSHLQSEQAITPSGLGTLVAVPAFITGREITCRHERHQCHCKPLSMAMLFGLEKKFAPDLGN